MTESLCLLVMSGRADKIGAIGTPEEQLIAGAREGNREAFAQLYELHVDRVYRYVLARLRNQADAEDVTSEVFIKAMKGLRSYRPKGSPIIAWLVRIAHNEAMNYVKKRARHPEAPLVEVGGSDDPAKTALTQATLGEVSRAMEDLTDLQRQILRLRFAAELSIAETGKIMNRDEGAVKFLQFSALRALRRILDRQESDNHVG